MVSLDAQVALASGLPPMVESKLYDVNPIDEADEVGTQDRPLSEARKTILGVFVGGRFSFYRHTCDFLRILNKPGVTTSDVDDILDLTRNIRQDMAQRREQILQMIQSSHGGSVEQSGSYNLLHQAESNPALAYFASLVLSMLAAKPFAIMYGPLRKQGLLSYLRSQEPK